MTHTPFGVRRIGSGMQVQQGCALFQHLEAVRASFGNEQGAILAGGQLDAAPLQEGRRTGAQIQHHIEDPAGEAADELFLGVRWVLEMHAAHAARLGGEGIVDLHDAACSQQRRQFVFAEPAREAATRIATAHARHHHRAIDAGRLDAQVHDAIPAASVSPRSSIGPVPVPTSG